LFARPLPLMGKVSFLLVLPVGETIFDEERNDGQRINY
jgi:hypothetical protein